MAILQDKAYAIAEDMNKDNEHLKHLTLDPMMILTIISVLTQLFKAYQECQKTPEATVASIQSPGILERWKLRRIIKQTIDDPEMNEHVGAKMATSAMKVGKTVSVEEVQQCYNEVGIPV